MVPAVFRNLLFALALCASAAAAAPRALDQARIHANYHDGEFDKVIKEAEGFLKTGRSCAPAESVFLEKHLAVVYAANPGTRELGRYHMFRLLDLSPGTDLLDMFVGEEVDAVFEKVRKEHALRLAARKPAPAPTAKPRKAPVPAAAPVPARASWETAALAKPAPAKTETSKAAHFRAASGKSSWDILPSEPAHSVSARALPTSQGTFRVEGRDAGAPGTPASAASGENASGYRSASPAWKEPGLWVGAGAALAVVAFTWFYSGSSDAAPEAKTYVVPASTPN